MREWRGSQLTHIPRTTWVLAISEQPTMVENSQPKVRLFVRAVGSHLECFRVLTPDGLHGRGALSSLTFKTLRKDNNKTAKSPVRVRLHFYTIAVFRRESTSFESVLGDHACREAARHECRHHPRVAARAVTTVDAADNGRSTS